MTPILLRPGIVLLLLSAALLSGCILDTRTGLAVSNLTDEAAEVLVVIYDETGEAMREKFWVEGRSSLFPYDDLYRELGLGKGHYTVWASANGFEASLETGIYDGPVYIAIRVRASGLEIDVAV